MGFLNFDDLFISSYHLMDYCVREERRRSSPV